MKYSTIALSILALGGCAELPTSNPDQVNGQLMTEQASSDFDKLAVRLIPDMVARQVRLATRDNKSVAEVADEMIAAMQENGSWDGINYESKDPKGWTPRTHLDNMRMMAAAYVETGNEIYADATNKALTYWFNAKPSAHWWWEDIGKPMFLGEVGLMLGKSLPKNIRLEMANVMPNIPGVKMSTGQKVTGGNRSDINKIVAMRGLLEQNDQLVGEAIKDIEAGIFVTTGEGIQPDMSFHQHGPQLYSAAYGEVWFNATLKWAHMVNDLQWKFSQDKLDLLGQFYLDGWRWMRAGNTFDYNTWGRSLSRPKPESAKPVRKKFDDKEQTTQMEMIAELVPARASEALAYQHHVEGGPAGLNGFKHFWRSDYATKVADGHFFGIRMNSQRVVPNESGNGENMLGYWLGQGSTFLMQRGDEYFNIFPVMDWTKVPGVTAPDYAGPSGKWGKITMPDASFVGGVSNGEFGIAVMDMSVQTQPESGPAFTTQAKKAWFNFDDEIVALGANVGSTHQSDLHTTLNQTLLNGEVTVNGHTLPKGEHAFDAPRWVHHDGVGYFFLEQAKVQLDNQTETGDWKRIKTNQPNTPVSKDVFTLSINHGTAHENSEYQYMIVPEIDTVGANKVAKSNPVSVLANSSTQQVVHHQSLNVTGIVFYEAGEVSINNELTISADAPSLLLLDRRTDTPLVSLATPGVENGNVTVTLSSKQGVKTRTFTTPTGPELLGQSVTLSFD